MIDVMLYLQDFEPSDFQLTSGISGSWYDRDRDGEGFMIDIAAEGVVAVSFYTYDTTGNQLWLVGAGHVDGNTFEIAFYSTDGAVYGDAFDPLDVNRYLWGTGTFMFDGCLNGTASIVPNGDFSGEFDVLDVTLSRLTTPVSCTGG